MLSSEYIQLIKDCSRQLNVSVETISNNWILKLTKADKTEYIVGYSFPLNTMASGKIMRHKNTCHEILSLSNIPSVPHHLIFHPSVQLKQDRVGGYSPIIDELQDKYGYPLVLKLNNSSNGESVIKANNRTELESGLHALFATDKALCICPYRQVLGEYRAVILDGKCHLLYEKDRPYLTGDGYKKIVELVDQYSNTHKTLPDLQDLSLKLLDIPEKGEKIYFSWKHNAIKGMSFPLINDSDIEAMASIAAHAVGGRFASVDIIRSKEKGLEVLEINASVVLSNFSTTSETHYLKARQVYLAALQKLF